MVHLGIDRPIETIIEKEEEEIIEGQFLLGGGLAYVTPAVENLVEEAGGVGLPERRLVLRLKLHHEAAELGGAHVGPPVAVH